MFNNRGLAYAKLKQFEKAIQDYDQAIELNPKDFNAFNNRGPAYAKLKQFEKAIQDYNQAIELNPKDARTFNNVKNIEILWV
jgi:tetratricopeptide (TPR) repeat protein